MAVLNQTEKIKVEGLYKAYGKRRSWIISGFRYTRASSCLYWDLPAAERRRCFAYPDRDYRSKNGGRILKDGVDISGFEPAKRGMGIVFQNYALFPNMTALQNVEYALKLHPDFLRLPPAKGHWKCCRRWGWKSTAGKNRISCPAASSSAWPLRARWRCSPMCFAV